MGEWLQRALCILFLLCFPISAGWLSAEPLLLALGQSAEVAGMTGAYIRQGPSMCGFATVTLSSPCA